MRGVLGDVTRVRVPRPRGEPGERAGAGIVIFCCTGTALMATDESSSGASSSSSTTELKGLIKDSLRELLQEEPTLFSQGPRVAGNGEEEPQEGKLAVFFLFYSDGLVILSLGELFHLGARGRPRGGGGRRIGLLVVVIDRGIPCRRRAGRPAGRRERPAVGSEADPRGWWRRRGRGRGVGGRPTPAVGACGRTRSEEFSRKAICPERRSSPSPP